MPGEGGEVKDRLFWGNRGMDGELACPPDKICVCLRLSKAFYLEVCRRAAREGTTTGEYIEGSLRAWEALAPGNRRPPAFYDAPDH